MWGVFRGTPLLLALASVLATAPVRAGGWQEIHETSDDVRIEVADDGQATVWHHLRYRVVAGHFKTLDFVGIEPHAAIAPEAVVTAEKGGGADITARAEPVDKAPGTLRVLIDDARGLGRGTYLVDVRYRLDLVALHALSRDGAMWKLAWTAPPASEGHDGARIVFDLPSAPTEPRLAASADTTTTLATTRRGAGRDELELVRAHVPRGEAVTWTARVDPKAFPRVVTPELRPPPPHEAPPPSLLEANLARIGAAGALTALALALGALLRAKQNAARRAAALRGALARPLVAVPGARRLPILGPVLYAVVTTLGFVSLLGPSPTAGAVLVAFGIALAAHRAPAPIARPRRPGEWRSVPDRVLLPAPARPLPTDGLDVGTPRGRLALTAVVGVVGVVAVLARSRMPELSIALPIAATAILPVFLTGTRAQMIPSRPAVAATLLRPARDALAAAVDLTHVEVATIGRVVDPSGAFDELRLACAPKDRTPGLRAVELAVATCPSGGAAHEILLRFEENSPAADRIARLAQLLGAAPVLRGRGPTERVARLVPEEPSAAAAASLLGRLVLSLEGRRATDRHGPPSSGRWAGPERRLRPAAAC